MSKRHPQRLELLAWLDGELTPVAHWRVRRHLRRCWTCRRAVAELEKVVQQITAAAGNLPDIPVLELSRAKWRFREAASAWEEMLSQRSSPWTVRRLLWAVTGVATASATVWTGVRGAARHDPAVAHTTVAARPAANDRPALANRLARVDPSSMSIPASRVVAPPRREPALVSPARLAALEVEVLTALHSARLCTSDAVQVSATEHEITISAVALDIRQRDALRMLLQPLSDRELLHLHLEAPGPIAYAPALVSGGLPVLRKPMAEAWLREQLGPDSTQRELSDLMNAVVTEAENLAPASWALENLAKQFPSSREALLDAASRKRLRDLAADHANETARSLATIGAVFTSLNRRLPDSRDGAALQGTWQEAVHTLHPLIRRTSDLLLRLFASNDSGLSAPADLIETPQFLSDLRQSLTRLRRLLAGETH